MQQCRSTSRPEYSIGGMDFDSPERWRYWSLELNLSHVTSFSTGEFIFSLRCQLEMQCNLTDASLACDLTAAGSINSTSINWACICSLHFSSNWRCCEYQHLDYQSISILWFIYIALAIAFSWYSNLVEEFKMSVYDLHDIPTQGKLNSVLLWVNQV